MNKEMKKVTEYLTPKCKMVDIHPQSVVCGSTFDPTNNTEIITIDEEEEL